MSVCLHGAAWQAACIMLCVCMELHGRLHALCCMCVCMELHGRLHALCCMCVCMELHGRLHVCINTYVINMLCVCDILTRTVVSVTIK